MSRLLFSVFGSFEIIQPADRDDARTNAHAKAAAEYILSVPAATCGHTDIVKDVAVHNFYEKLCDDGTHIYICMDCDYEKGEDETKIALDNTVKILNDTLNDLAQAQAKVTELTKKFNKADSDLAATNSNLKEKEAQVNELTQALNEAQNELNDVNTDNKNKDAQIASLTSSLEKAKSDLEKLVCETKAKISAEPKVAGDTLHENSANSDCVFLSIKY